MIFDFPLYSLAFFFGGILTLYYSCVAYMRRPAAGASFFSFFALACCLWTLAGGLEAGAIGIGLKTFCSKLEYIGTASSGIFWLLFALDFSGSKWWRHPRNLTMILIIPIVILFLVWTNDSHHWYWTNIYLADGTFGNIGVYEHGPLFWVFTTFLYTMYLSGIFILWRFGLRKPRLFRWQIIILFLGTLVPMVGSVIYLCGISPIKGLDIVPFTFILAGIIYAITLFRFRLLDIIPVARGKVVEIMPDGILVLDASDIIADMNPSAEDILKTTAESAIGKRLDQIWPKLDVMLANLKAGQHTEITADASIEPRFLDVSITPLRNIKGGYISGNLVVLRDITANRRIEQTLRDSESRYEALVEQSNDGVLIIQDGVFRFANHTLADTTGYSVEEIVGKSLPFLVADEDAVTVNERYRLRMAGISQPSVYEIRLQTKNGEKRNVEITVGAITYAGKIASMVTIRDITERKLAQYKLETLYREELHLRNSLQEEIDKRAKYTRSLVHELRTPLTSILASGELLESEIHDDIYLSLVKNIRRASLNLEQRINELTELARGETGMLKINSQPLNMVELLNEVVSETTPITSGKGLTLAADIVELPEAYGDRSRLRQVMANLLGNAIKFTSRGTITIRARIFDAEAVVVQVQDTGRGIQPDEMVDIFDPYRRKTRSGQELGGLGIGLALSKIIIDLHHGKIWVESTPGNGATFSFTVPVYKKA